MYQPSELMAFLRELSVTPKKGLSQNFLIDGNIVRKILKTADVQPEDVILEIGAGAGVLTQALLERGCRVLAVEKDPPFAHALNRLQTPSQHLTVYCEDILKFPITQQMAPLLQGKKGKVIANLPYHLTTHILISLAPLFEVFSSLTLMVQEEVARRLTAEPGSSVYGSLSVFLRFYSSPRYAFFVSRQCFYPVPQVGSAIVRLDLRAPPLKGEAAESFFLLTRTAFKQRRKMLRSSLKELFFPQAVEAALEKIGQNPLARPEMLSLEQFLELHALLT